MSSAPGKISFSLKKPTNPSQGTSSSTSPTSTAPQPVKIGLGAAVRTKPGSSSSTPASRPAAPPPRTAFDPDVDDGEPSTSADVDAPKVRPGQPSTKPPTQADQATQAEALALDSSIYDYDSALDKIQLARHRVKEEQQHDKAERKPKYMAHFLEKAELRKRDRQRAESKMIQREREAEGDTYEGTEAFVTDAYKEHLEQIKRDEEREAAEDAQSRVRADAPQFREEMLRRQEAQHAAVLSAAGGGAEDSRAEDQQEDLAARAKAQGKKLELNDEGEVVDERQLLSTGLNVIRKAKPAPARATRAESAERSKDEPRDDARRMASARREQRARQSRLIEEQMLDLERQQAQQAEQEREQRKQQLSGVASDADKANREARVEVARQRALERKRKRQEG